METSNLPDVEFKNLLIRMLNELRESADKLCENFTKETENIKMEIKKT